MDNKLHANISVRLFTDEKCFGPGIALLLHRINEHKSLRSAAISMGMAYSKAWTILKSSEKSLGFKLLNSTIGGKNGGGAMLTEDAKAILAAYDEYCAELKKYADKLFDKKFSFYKEKQDSKE
ncbi:MAG: LysR family transcriptional regulator [Clostridiales bacterium]|nr:LysR family transcriptional regulator [Clostridiales bacterium]